MTKTRRTNDDTARSMCMKCTLYLGIVTALLFLAAEAKAQSQEGTVGAAEEV